MAEQMAEYAAYAVLRHFREFPFYAASSAPPGGRGASGRTSVVPGRRAGPRRARCARGGTVRDLGFPVLGCSRAPKAIGGVTRMHGTGGPRGDAARCRVLIALLPLTPATTGLLDRRVLGALPRGAVLVNLARGALVVDDDLLALLDEGHLAAAMLDVFTQEPLPVDHRFWHHPGSRSPRTSRGSRNWSPPSPRSRPRSAPSSAASM